VQIDLKNRQQLLLAVTLSLAALFALDKVALGPLTSLWKARAKEVADLRRKVSDGGALVDREKNLRERWDRMRTNTLPENFSMAEQQVLRAFDKWSQDSKVSMTSISSQWKHDAEEYMTLQYHVEVAGDINALSRFLYDVERDPMAIKLENVEISSRDTEGRQLTLGLQMSGLTLITGAQQK
jgi:Tfp pilus assembly protein PilO